MTPNSSLCVLLCSHNRRDKTLACLAALQASTGLAGTALSAVLVDDGSSDGTAQAVALAHPWVSVLHGDGSLYWCRAMHLAFAHAMRESHDHYLWLNDDTLLHPNAVARLLATAQERAATTGRAVIRVGSSVDPQSGVLTYGGRAAAPPWRPTAWPLLAPSETAQAITTMDGNVVLLSDAAAALTGNLDAAFQHAMGDQDYGLRAAAQGVGLWLAPGVHATCSDNPRQGGFTDLTLGLRQRFLQMLAPTGLPWRSWWRFTRRHTGLLWPVYFAWPYVRVAMGMRPLRTATQRGSTQRASTER